MVDGFKILDKFLAIFSKLKSLQLSSNQIESLKEVKKMNSLESNKIKSLKELENLTKLNTLHLHLNRIQSLEGIQNLNKLTFLNLLSNEIQLNGNFCFNENYPLVKSIDLKRNHVKRLLAFSFINMKNLLSIFLDENVIEFIETNAFYNLPSIELISLRKNQIKSLDDFFFYNVNINFSLHLFGNTNITQISKNSLTNLFTAHFSLSLNFKIFDSFNTKNLDLTNNGIKIIFKNTIKGNFLRLILNDNLITLFEINSFGYFPNLTKIYFVKNLIRKLDFHNAFEFKIVTLKILDFSFNKIDSIDGVNFFSKFPILDSLDLSFNEFHSLLNSYFPNLSQLKYLYLNNNQILTIQNETFNHLKNLIHLDLSQNLIYDLSVNFSFYLSNLKELHLKSNELERISKENIQGLISLKHFDLSQNHIFSLENDIFSHSVNISILKLSSNKLRSLNKSVDILKSLLYLDISSNNLTFSNFSLFKNLSFLDLSHNIYLKFQII